MLGLNNQGQLGDGTTTDRPTPVFIPSLSDAVDVAVGVGHSCIVRATGAVWCWGANIAVGSPSNLLSPVTVPGVTNAVAVGCGDRSSCARTATGELRCWGMNVYGLFGDGTTTLITPAPVAFGGYTDVARAWIGGRNVCVQRAGGNVWCAGANHTGILGTGQYQSVQTTPVATFSGAQSMALGDLHACSLTSGVVRCAGWNTSGSVGNGVDPRLPGLVRR